MSDLPSYPNDPSSSSDYGAPTQGSRGPKPASISMAVNLIWAAVALSVISTIVSFVTLDETVDLAMEADTSGTLSEDAARATAIAFAVILLIIGVAIYAVLAIFLSKGHNWARIVYTVLAVIFLLLGIFGLLGDQTALSLVLSLVQIVLIAATLFFLWKKESSAWLTGRSAT